MTEARKMVTEPLVEPLTRREREVLGLLAQGLSGPEIAEKLTLAVSSVKWHIQQVYGKLGVNSKREALDRASELGLLEVGRKHPDVAPHEAAAAHNLPQSITNFIGREHELADVKHMLLNARLVTLTGVGGSGKTRLALRVGADVLDMHPNGVWLVDLTPISNSDLVPHKAAAALGVAEEPGQPVLITLVEYLRSRQLMVILDNCEHLVVACAEFSATLLGACPGLTLLATSREALAVAGEMLYPLPALAYPDLVEVSNATTDGGALDSLNQYDAVRLFVERATAVLPTFRLNADNALAVAQVCQQLDGIPLAIELAAARVKLLSVGQIAGRLAAQDRFDLLTAGRRTAPQRHQTLRAMLDWSHDLLPNKEQSVFHRLAVFAGGFTFTAATAVSAAEGIAEHEVLHLLSLLVDKSLVLVEPAAGTGEPRYRLLETVRQYAFEKLEAEQEAEATLHRHAEFFLNLAEQAEPRLESGERELWFGRLEAEQHNLRAAMTWSQARASAADMLKRLASALFWFWIHAGTLSEGRSWVAAALGRVDDDTPMVVRAKLLSAAGHLAAFDRDPSSATPLLDESTRLWRTLGSAGEAGLAHSLVFQADVARNQGDANRAVVLAEEAVALFRGQSDQWGLALALTFLALAVRDQEDFVRARTLIAEGVALWRDQEDGWGLWLGLLFAGMVATRQGDYEAALRFHNEAFAIARERSDNVTIAGSLNELAIVMLNLDDQARARPLFEESLRRFRELGLRFGIAYNLLGLGMLAICDGNQAQAQAMVKQALDLANEVGRSFFRGDCLKGLAGLAAIRGQSRRAAQLWGAAEGVLAAASSYMDNGDCIFFGRVMTAAQTDLGEAAFEAARAEGRTMTAEEAISYALAVPVEE